MTPEDILASPYDPWILLGVPRDADDREVELAWRRAGSAEEGILFDAYRLLQNEQSRKRLILLGPRPFSRAIDAIPSLKRRPRYIGPEKWYEFISRNRPR